MTPEEFRAISQLLFGDAWGWGIRGAAEFMGVSERNVKRFGNGDKPLPGALGRILKDELVWRLVDAQDRTPALVVIREALSGVTSLPARAQQGGVEPLARTADQITVNPLSPAS